MAGTIHAFADDALTDLDASGIAAEIEAGRISAREATEAAISRAEAVARSLHPFAATDFDRALEQSVRPRPGLFSGVPTVVKDNVDVTGLPTNHGTEAFTARPATEDSAFVKQFRTLGGTILGKSRLPEFGFSASTEFMAQEPVRNPWDTDYSCGASSGGSAALVAAGVVPFAHANDGGGSIRIPAAACGLVGLKPTRGRIVPDLSDTLMPVRLVTQGVLTRSVRDTAAFFAAAEAHHRNPRLAPVRHVRGPSSTRLRIGVVLDSVTSERTDDETRHAVTETADLLAALGHHVEEIALPVTAQFAADFRLYWGLLAFAISRTGKRVLDPAFDRSRTDNLTRGLSAMYTRNMARTPAVVHRLRRTSKQYAQMFQAYDVVLSPVLTHTTPRLGHLSPRLDFAVLFDRLTDYVGFTPFNNAAGGPALSLPLGRTLSGLPLASHFSAAHGDERTLLELAYELEQAAPWARIQAPPEQPV